MTLIAINCGERLSGASRLKLGAIIGKFTERCPRFEGENLFRMAWKVLNEPPPGQARRDIPAMCAAMDDVISQIRISDEEWATCDIIVLLASNWNTAGIEITQIATLEAVERRKAGAIRWMVFGNGMLTDSQPMTSSEDDVRSLAQ